MRRLSLLLACLLLLVSSGEGQVYTRVTKGGFADVSSTGLVGWWKLNDCSGTSATDSSGQGNTGTLTNGPTWAVPGKIGPCAVTFDGTNDYVSVANEPNFDFERTDAFTISNWVKTSNVANVPVMVGKAGTASGYTGYYTVIRNNGKVELFVQGAGGTNFIRVQGSTTISDGAWHHIVATYAGTSLASGVTLYVDGVAETPTILNNNLGTNSILNNIAVQLGARDAGASLPLTGSLDDVRIYNRALSAAEVAVLYSYR